MKLVSYLLEGHDQLAFLVDDLLYDCDLVHPELPNSMNMFLNYWDDMYPVAQRVNESIRSGKVSRDKGFAYSEAHVLCPVTFPTSCRESNGFNATDAVPGLQFLNHHAIQGPGNILCMPDHLLKLDYEMKVAAVICKYGRNIKAAEADDHIGGFLVMNQFCARAFEEENEQLQGGFAKGKDFSIVLGPCLVTTDELEGLLVEGKTDHTGKNWGFTIKASMNGVNTTEANTKDMNWTFAEIIERASYGATLQPGDIISSGTALKGSLADLNKARISEDANYTAQWLKPDDIVEIEIEGIGKISSTIVAEESAFSILPA